MTASTGTERTVDAPLADQSEKLRVLFLITVVDGAEQRFLEAYDAIRHRVAQVPGHLQDQVCQSTTDPAQWVITSEWRSADHFAEWERSEAHRTLVAPLRDCLTEPRSMRFVVRRETA